MRLNLDDFIQAERARPEDPSALSERLWSRIQSGVRGGLSATEFGAQALQSTVTSGVSKLTALSIFVVGVGGGVVVDKTVLSPIEAQRPSFAPTPVKTIRPRFKRSRHQYIPRQPTELVQTPPPSPKTEIATSKNVSSTFTEEQRLINTARVSLRKRRYSLANEALGAHASRFPSGQLSELRELLRIRCAVEMGQGKRAQQLKDAFAQRYPQSSFLPTIEKILTTSE